MSPEGNAPYVLPYYYCQRRQTGLDPGGFEKNNVLQYVTGVGIYRVFGRLWIPPESGKSRPEKKSRKFGYM